MILITGILSNPQGLKDGTYKVTLNFNEVAPETLTSVLMMNNKFVYIAIKEEPFLNEEKKAIESLKSDETVGKTPSQRLRAVDFVAWKRNNEGFSTFDQYYRHKMEYRINKVKNNLDE